MRGRSIKTGVTLLAFCIFACACTGQGGGSALEGWERLLPEQPGNPGKREPQFLTRGLVTGWNEVARPEVIDYIGIAGKNGINTFSIYGADRSSAAWKDFFHKARSKGIDFEFEEHMMYFLLPRDLFPAHPEYFRMDRNGIRTDDANGCPSSKAALEVVKAQAKELARRYEPTNDRYYFWMDDGGGICHCPKCRFLTASDQALIFENAVIEAVKEINPNAEVAHLCYHETLDPPVHVTPRKDIFLEFAPFFRNWEHSLLDSSAKGRTGITHAEYLAKLKANLKVFPAETAQILEYWMDESLFSGWDKDNLVEVPWNPEVFKKDLDVYAGLGIRHIMCYCAYVGPEYVGRFGPPSFLEEYGRILSSYEKL